MKKLVLILSLITFSLIACESSEGESNQVSDAISNILIDGVSFVPTTAKVQNSTSNMAGEAALLFTLERGQSGTANYEAVIFKINYPLTSSSAPNGVYDFGIGVIGETLFAQGSYIKGNNNSYGLAGYTVKVTALGNNKFKLEFQNIQAVSFITGATVIISGSYEGTFL